MSSEQNIWKNKKIHFIGIKGTGMSGLAQILLYYDAKVSGSDSDEKFPTDIRLKNAKIEPKLFSENNIQPELDMVIYSVAYNEAHPERKKARDLKIPELSYSKALALFAKSKENIVVTGTHGKTTTTALLGTIFETAGFDPTVLVGDNVLNWDNSIRIGSSKYFIVEGDEYENKFRLFNPIAIVIPALDYDHVDYFKSEQEYLETFKEYLVENPEARFVTTSEVTQKLNVPADFCDEADKEIFKRSKFIFPGEKYRSNCLLAIHLSRFFGINPDTIIKGINSFKGVGRRLEICSDLNDKILIIYDYAHHPAEIESTLEALQARYPERTLIAIFQPHTYSRTKAFLKEFAKSYSRAQIVFLDEIHGSAREKSGDITIDDLILETKKVHQKVYKLSEFSSKKLLEIAMKEKNPLIILMGAGDIWQKAKKLAEINAQTATP
jgi:UDP-N-acetylmuramate--alanine ligase